MERQAVILVVDDEEVIRDSCRQILERRGFSVETAADASAALSCLRRRRFDLVLLDLKMPGMDGEELMRRMRADFPDPDVIVITGYSSVGSAVDCMRLGAYDYLPKPFDAETLRLVVGRAWEKRRLILENQALRRRLGQESPPDVLQGRSRAILGVQEIIRRVAPTDSTVLIMGESGTGKELVARAIHRGSTRRNLPMMIVDCGALVESLCESELFGHVKGAFTGAVSTRPGRFELADRGTILLDEIGNIGPVMQGKLLRMLQERETTRVGSAESIRVDVRIIAATNRNLRAAMYAGQFREDLFYRLSVVLIEIPPLRTRREDIPLLTDDLLRRLCERRRLPLRRVSPQALRMMQIHSWPGNVRELENTLERALVLAPGPEIRPEDLYFSDQGVKRSWNDVPGDPFMAADGESEGDPDDGGSCPEFSGDDGRGALPSESPQGAEDLKLAAMEARHIRLVLRKTGGHFARAAELLGIDRKTLRRKIREYQIR